MATTRREVLLGKKMDDFDLSLRSIARKRPKNYEELKHIVGRAFTISETPEFEEKDFHEKVLYESILGYREELKRYLLNHNIDEESANRITKVVCSGTLHMGKSRDFNELSELMYYNDVSYVLIWAMHYIIYIYSEEEIERYAKRIYDALYMKYASSK